MKCIIFANGPLQAVSLAQKAMIMQHDLVLATDGGALHCHSFGIMPHIVVGDMDSIPEWLLVRLQQQGVETLTFPQRKDKTDLELAIDLAIERGIKEMTILGALGERWDMSISSIMLLTATHYEGVRITLSAGMTTLFCLRGPALKQLAGYPGDRLSLLPLGGAVKGVTLHGLEYPLTDHLIPLGSTLGISNIITDPQIIISLKEGILLCVIERLTTSPLSSARQALYYS